MQFKKEIKFLRLLLISKRSSLRTSIRNCVNAENLFVLIKIAFNNLLNKKYYK